MNYEDRSDEGFLYRFFEKFIDFLFTYTFFERVKVIFKIEKGRTAADIYVCTMFILSVLMAVLSRYMKCTVILIIILIHIIYRIYEITVTLVYNFFVSKQTKEQQEEKRVFSIKRCILLFLINVIEIIHHFITVYIGFAYFVRIQFIPSYVQMFKASTYAFVTYNTDMINEISNRFSNISFVQSLMGIFYAVILFAMLIGNVPKIESISEN